MSSSSASAGGIVRRVSSERRMFSRAAGWMRSSSGRISPRISPRVVAGVRRVDPELDAALAAERLRLLAPERQQRPHDAVLAPGLDPLQVAARRRAGRGSSRPGRSRCARSRAAGRAPARSEGRAARLVEPGAVGADDLGAEHLGAEARVRVRLGAAQPVVDVERRGAVAELAQREHEAGRVGAARDEAEHLAAGLDQLVAPDVRLDPREHVHRRSVHHSERRSREPALEHAGARFELVGA